MVVYRKARESARQIFVLSTSFPPEEKYSLTDQGRRSARSIGAQIAEAWAKRRYPKYFAAKLSDAEGETNETQHWLDTAVDCGYLTQDQGSGGLSQLGEISAMLRSMTDRAEEFQGEGHGKVRESRAPYGSMDEFFSQHSLLNTQCGALHTGS